MKMKDMEDMGRDTRVVQAGKKQKRKRRKGRPEDLEFTDTGDNVYLLTVHSP